MKCPECNGNGILRGERIISYFKCPTCIGEGVINVKTKDQESNKCKEEYKESTETIYERNYERLFKF